MSNIRQVTLTDDLVIIKVMKTLLRRN